MPVLAAVAPHDLWVALGVRERAVALWLCEIGVALVS